MRAVWYEQQGAATDVLHVGELPLPEPVVGEVEVQLRVLRRDPGDVKRQGWLGLAMPYPRVLPHNDGAGVIDAIGFGVDKTRIGQRVGV